MKLNQIISKLPTIMFCGEKFVSLTLVMQTIRREHSKVGATITKKKSKAARENGKLGGRPIGS